ncbi:DUF6686 family protein [Flagellimonas sp. HSM57]|uniref:DUF6686 family protein n=1 Tax=unclassified Flagellimonas TaxID=2644544 RepID=UPI00293C01FE|nr:DUF6686 family protein [Flagellimonas sp. HSM57]
MYQSLEVLSQTKNGLFTFCNHSKLFQLVFNNLCFEFYEWELENFKKYIFQLDVTYWEKNYIQSLNQRKIPISVGNKFFTILVNKQELDEIKNLLHIEFSPIKLLKHKDINYQFIEN